MKFLNRKTRKAIRKTVKKVVKKHGPEIAAGLAGGIASGLATLASSEAAGRNGRSKLSVLSQRFSATLRGERNAVPRGRSGSETRARVAATGDAEASDELEHAEPNE